MAGTALGCHFSSSAEYEAALIAERRKAGAYQRHVWQRLMPLMLMLASALIVMLFF